MLGNPVPVVRWTGQNVAFPSADCATAVGHVQVGVA